MNKVNAYKSPGTIFTICNDYSLCSIPGLLSEHHHVGVDQSESIDDDFSFDALNGVDDDGDCSRPGRHGAAWLGSLQITLCVILC